MGLSLGRVGLVVLATWLGLLFYISSSLVRVPPSTNSAGDSDSGPIDDALRRIKAALSDIEELKRQNAELRQLLQSRRDSKLQSTSSAARSLQPASDALSSKEHPALAHFSREHEELRRELERNVWELWFMTKGELDKVRAKADEPTKKALSQFLSDLEAQWEWVVGRSELLGSLDGADDWRNERLRNLSSFVQARLQKLQNPADCSKVRMLQCVLNKGCGFGCQIHHASYCAIVAYATGRTLLLETKSWRYSSKGWTSVFQPVGSCEGSVDTSEAVQWKGPDQHDSDNIVSLPIIDSLRPSPDFLPLSFPKAMAEELVHLHGNPPAWYLMRLSPQLQAELKEKEDALHFKSPIVGLHVRRTDKLGSEAQFHALSEYMEWARRWFQIQEFKGVKVEGKRRVFLATDEKNLLADARKEYPDWEIIGSADVAASAQLSSRYSDSSLHGVIQDIHFLSLSDYLVCTFSSQVCRVAYELMQVRRGDWAHRFHSLDDLFYFGGQHAHEVIAVLAHEPSKEGAASVTQRQISMEPGDVIGIAGNHWDGWSKGRNVRTGELGLFPSYKVREKWRIVPFGPALS